MEHTRGRPRQAWRIARWTIIIGLLSAPWIAMKFTDQVNWTSFDFLIMGVLLIGAGLSYELAALKLRKSLHRTLLGAGLVALVLIIWAEGAVGIFH
ncbi:hypothetical protein [Phenylobacterium sp.]|uniref:hypothetical protein n=1 Tax=Phenylobacterium sp. TaxID=1871053 RepID=UPI00286E61A1|nr:hypothetical protein [Phenylobacterium sp.]